MRSMKITLRRMTIIALLALTPSPAWSQNGEANSNGNGDGNAAAAAAADAHADVRSPRATMQTFLEAVAKVNEDRGNEAARARLFRTLELPSAQGDARIEQALDLWGVLNKLGEINPQTMLPDDAAAEQQKLTSFEFFPENPNPAAKAIFDDELQQLGDPPGAITLTRAADGAWKFSAETFNQLVPLLDYFEQAEAEVGPANLTERSLQRQFRKWLPDWARQQVVIEVWQWIGLLVVIFLAVLVDLVARLAIAPVLRRLVRRHVGETDDQSVRRGVLPKDKVRMATFGTISLSIFACAVLCILGVWGFSDDGTPWRALASLGIIAGAMVAFTVVNEIFGQTVKEPAVH